VNDVRSLERRNVRKRTADWREVSARRPYSSGHRLRVAVSAATVFLGVLILSMPAWLITSPSESIERAIVAAAGAVLLSSGIASLISERLNPVYDSVVEAFEQQLDPDAPDNIRAVIQHEVVSALAELSDSSVDFGPRAKLFSRLDLVSAEEEVLIQGISLSQKWQTTQLLEDLFRRQPDFQVRILLMHPFSKLAALRDRDLDFRPGTIRQLVDETIVPLASLHRSLGLGDRLQVRGYLAIPYYGFTMCDRRKVALSLSREGRGGDQNMGIYLEANSRAASALVSDLVGGFEARWDRSCGLLEQVQVQFAPGTERRSETSVYFEITSDRELDIESIKIRTTEGLTVKVSQIEELRYSCSTTNLKVDQTFVVEQVISGDRQGWLRAPVEILVPASNTYH
jgi:hypothetical protein